MNTCPVIPPRRHPALAALCMLLGLVLVPAAGAQSERTQTAARRVTQCWILIGGEEFKQRFEGLDSNAMMAGAAETRALLVEAERTGLITILAQPQLESADRVATKFATLVEVPAPRSEDSSGQDRNLFIELFLTAQAEGNGGTLLSLRLTLKALTPNLSISASAVLNGPRSMSSKVLLDAGEAVLLNLSSTNAEAQATPTRSTGEDLLMVLAPENGEDVRAN